MSAYARMEDSFKYVCLTSWVEPVRLCWSKGQTNSGSWVSRCSCRRCVCTSQQMFQINKKVSLSVSPYLAPYEFALQLFAYSKCQSPTAKVYSSELSITSRDNAVERWTSSKPSSAVQMDPGFKWTTRMTGGHTSRASQ